MAENKQPNEELDTKVVPPTEPKKKPAAKKTIEVDPDFLANLQKQVDRLTAAADLNRLAKYDAERANEGQVTQTAAVTFLDGSAVLATRLVKDEVYVDSRGVYHEEQMLEVFVEGEAKPLSISYRDFEKRKRKTTGEITSRTKEKDFETLKIVFKDGKEITIDSKFIN